MKKKNHLTNAIYFIKSHIKLLTLSLIIIICIFLMLLFIWNRIAYDEQGLPKILINEGPYIRWPLVSYKFVKSRPDAKLYYPNGKVYSQFGGDQVQTDEGLGVAFTGSIMTTTDPPVKVYQWYHEQLIKRGWHENQLLEHAKADTQLSVNDYEKGKREIFEVAIDNPKTLGMTIGSKVPNYETIFEFSYMIR